MLAITFNRNLPVNGYLRQPPRPGSSLLRTHSFVGKLCRTLASLLTLALLVSGCMVGPDFVKPDAEVEPVWM